MKRLVISILTASVMFAGSAMAQSAKFAAIYEDGDDAIIVKSDACDSTVLNYCSDLGLSDWDEDAVAWGAATIRVPQHKELLVGLSAQVGLYTFTEAKGKRGTRSTAVAVAEGGVSLWACPSPYDTLDSCVMGAPGYVVLSSREQELSAVLAGVIESCDVDVEVDFDDMTASGSFTLADCVVLDEAISLGLTTMAAHHFNFVFADMDQGDYDIVAKFQTHAGATAEVTCEYDSEDIGCSVEDGDATAVAGALIGKSIMTVQTVRAVKGSDMRGEVIEVLD